MIKVEGKSYHHDLIISLDGKVAKRKKKLSKELYGTSHILSLAEAKHVYCAGATRLVIGTGQTGLVRLSNEAEEFLRDKDCKVELLPTPQAIQTWNESEGAVIGLFHITC